MATTTVATTTVAAGATETPPTVQSVVEVETPPPLVFPGDAGLVDVTDYGAVGDGVADDTAALQQAISENVGRHRILFFPPGTYLVSDSLEWRDEAGDWQPYLTLQGAGREHTTIRLADGAAGFGDPGSVRAVIFTASGLFAADPFAGGKDYPERGEGNEAFRNYIFDLTIETGAQNHGAIGVDFLGNNISGIENVAIRSGDGTGQAGLSMTRKWPGPSLIKNVEIVGFDYGIDVAQTEYGITFEDIVLRDQAVAGIRNRSNVLSMHRIASTNQVPAVVNETALGLVTLVDAALEGGAPGTPAIENGGAVFLRSITTEGYASVLGDVDGTAIAEYAGPLTEALGGESLNLPIEDPPPIDLEIGLDSWTSVTDPSHGGGADPTDEEDDTAAIQAAFDSGAPVVYFPSSGPPWEGRYLVNDTISVPPTVEVILGFESVIAGGPDSIFTDEANFDAVLRVEDGGAGVPSLLIEGLTLARRDPPLLGAVWIDHSSVRTLVVRHVQWGGGARLAYSGMADGGRLFLEDVCCGALAFEGGQEVWARQLNVEKPRSPMLSNAGARLWILGVKTERPETIVAGTDGAMTELLGGLLYPVEEGLDDTPAFIAADATTSVVYAVSAYADNARNYHLQVLTDDAALTVEQVVDRGYGSLVPLYMAEP